MMDDFSPTLIQTSDFGQTLEFQEYHPDNSFVGNVESGKQEPSQPEAVKSIWSFEYYMDLFDVTTEQVVDRIRWAMIPQPKVNYFQQYIKPKPDLYGPFWICVTLIFTIAISGNLANYLQTAASAKYTWKYDFHAVTLAATAIFLYAWVLPIILWAALKWTTALEDQVSLLDLVCVYGYCLSIYVPVSLLWLIQISWLQWFLVLVGALLSGTVLFTSVYPIFSNKNLSLLLVVIILHFLLAAGFMLYFFHAPSSPAVSQIIPSNNSSS